MSETKSPWYNHPWILLLFAAFLSSPIFWDWFKGYKFSTTFQLIWSFVISIFLYKLSIIYVVILVIVISSIFYLIIKKQKSITIKLDSDLKKIKTEIDSKPRKLGILSTIPPKIEKLEVDFTDKAITETKAFRHNGLTWKWDWRTNPHTKRYEPFNAVPLCEGSDCDYHPLSMFEDSVNRNFLCLKCRKKYYVLPSNVAINTTIREFIRKKYSS